MYGFAMMTCTLSPLFRFTTLLLLVFQAIQNVFRIALMETFVTDISRFTALQLLV